LSISPDDSILEIGCGVGRLAIPATLFLNSSGQYAGIDIIRESIDWCTENISSQHPNFRFTFVDVQSQLHNPSGKKHCADVVFPVADESVDKIFLSSVFTHMLPDDVMHYLAKMSRALKRNGLVLTTMFLLNQRSMASIESQTAQFSFPCTVSGYRQCRVQNYEVTEGAVAYYQESYLTMLYSNGFELKRPIQPGHWSGAGAPDADGQDYVIFGKSLRH